MHLLGQERFEDEKVEGALHEISRLTHAWIIYNKVL